MTDARVLHAVASAFGLEITPQHPVRQGGAINRVLRVATPDRDVIVRIHSPETSPARLAAVHEVQHRLRTCGVPIPAILRTGRGATSIRVGDRLVEVLAYVPHGDEVQTWDDAALSLAALGTLHCWLRPINAPDLPPPVHACYITPDAGLSLLDTTRDAFQALCDEPGYARAVAIHDLTHDLIRHLELVWTRYAPALPRHLIHGDFVGKNVLIHDREVVAILDFDRLAVRPRVYDVAYTLLYVLNRLRRTGQRTPATDHELTADDLDWLGRVLVGYVASSHDELSGEEIAALPYEMARAILYPVVTAGQDLRHAIAETLDFGAHLPLCLWLVEHADAVSTRLREAVSRRGEAR